MDSTAQEKIINLLRAKFEGDILLIENPYNFLTITVKNEKIVELIQYLYNNNEAQFQYLTDLCGIHFPDQNKIAVSYQLHSLVNNFRIRIKIYLSADHPVTPTITPIFAAANWMERETYDFFGVQFEGHPNLKRILNVDEMLMFPLRKEFPLEDQVREDKKDFMFGR